MTPNRRQLPKRVQITGIEYSLPLPNQTKPKFLAEPNNIGIESISTTTNGNAALTQGTPLKQPKQTTVSRTSLPHNGNTISEQQPFIGGMQAGITFKQPKQTSVLRTSLPQPTAIPIGSTKQQSQNPPQQWNDQRLPYRDTHIWNFSLKQNRPRYRASSTTTTTQAHNAGVANRKQHLSYLDNHPEEQISKPSKQTKSTLGEERDLSKVQSTWRPRRAGNGNLLWKQQATWVGSWK
jgi:hypothetical protein